ncbi:hypothetical protein E1A91_D06G022600v1 [Gossypium mustelinum]|uniref:Uncharacterized protein n=3 Tax=Gossypium TaxID=3633 RepID=A0A5J5QY35_GOSBA|nr:hypothetical protein ES319_D06G020800v1 [Gossypium barbadense]TYH64979.1 hypothetical protein ES332_D06G024400v1 [Gossypium tomentosum]TYI75674.1 hypothetical protein E1A91_D06G022600v1 [Gossypium mustelinum]
MLSVHYIQKGLLFTKPASGDYCEQNLINNVLVRLKRSLSITLVHFYPLAGRFATKIEQNPKSHFVCVDCNNSPGAKFIHAAVDMSVYDIVSPTYVPLVVQAFFDHDRAINYEGHTRPLLSIQVTELIDGVFIGCSMNHAIADGTTFWHFFNTFSPVLERWFPEGNNGPLLILHFTHQDEFITRFETPHVLERILHFSAESIAKLKEKANTESNTTKNTRCTLAINNRSRLEPPLSPNYFANSFQTVTAMTTAGELLEHGLGWAAWKLNQAVVNHTDKSVRGFVRDWLQSPFVYQSSPHLYPRSLIIESSPRFNMYGNEFGLGKALTLRSGYGNKFDGKISPYPGREGEGSVDMEICLPPFSMNALESDEEFMAAVSAPI